MLYLFANCALDKSNATQLALPPLLPADSQQFIHTILPATLISESLMQTLVAKADGNPFFLEELARTVMEQGIYHALQTVPNTIQSALRVRLEQLPPAAKKLVQWAAVIGRDIPYGWALVVQDQG